MHKAVSAVLLCYISFIAFVLIQSSEAKDKEHYRNKRFLAFVNSSKFYLKFNIKDNMVPWNQLFAHTVGFRINWDVPPMNFHTFQRIHRRNVYSYVESLLDKNGINGYHCVRRAICEIQMISEPNRLYHIFLKIVLRKQSPDTERWHVVNEQECNESIMTCPFSLLEMSRYTDL